MSSCVRSHGSSDQSPDIRWLRLPWLLWGSQVLRRGSAVFRNWRPSRGPWKASFDPCDFDLFLERLKVNVASDKLGSFFRGQCGSESVGQAHFKTGFEIGGGVRHLAGRRVKINWQTLKNLCGFFPRPGAVLFDYGVFDLGIVHVGHMHGTVFLAGGNQQVLHGLRTRLVAEVSDECVAVEHLSGHNGPQSLFPLSCALPI